MSLKKSFTPLQQRFVDEYLVDLNATQAAIRAGYSAKTAEWIGPQLLGKSHVSEAISARITERAKRTEITQDMVLKRLWDIATADPNDIVQYRHVCCRHCYGIGHAYQWASEDEYAIALAKAGEKDGAAPSDAGGYGFDPSAEPNPKCPECHGDGIGIVHIADTRKLKGGAKLLYDGVRVTKGGMEVKLQDRSKALESVARHLGMYSDKLELTGPGGAPLQGPSIDPSKLSSEALAEILAARDAADSQ